MKSCVGCRDCSRTESARELMAEKNIGAVLVTEGTQRVGGLSERELLIRQLENYIAGQ